MPIINTEMGKKNQNFPGVYVSQVYELCSQRGVIHAQAWGECHSSLDLLFKFDRHCSRSGNVAGKGQV